MKKHILQILLVVFLVFISSNTIYAVANFNSSYKKNLGGKIMEGPKAKEITSAESDGHVCASVGRTFNIKPVSGGGITGPYLVQSGITGKGWDNISMGKWILGKYNSTPTTITCTHPDPKIPPKTINVYSVTIFGTSK